MFLLGVPDDDGVDHSRLQLLRDLIVLPLGKRFSCATIFSGCPATRSRQANPSPDDPREGKNAVLMALTRHSATPGQNRILLDLVENPKLDGAGAARVREVITSTGAQAHVEDVIRHRDAVEAIDGAPMPEPVKASLRTIAERVVDRAT
ncbi:polyprenyl synthetase [Streptomyces venezuelae]|nr:polyprenyl synthetase [Streptomyces venezuelae]CUM37221.1 putative polyprenyl synthase / dimethylallyltranstransferase [Streptomyces venezuelae]